MILSFELSMPSNNAWNGKWTGEENFYAVTHDFGKTKKAENHASEIIDNGPYYYNFGDGWTACVKVKKVTAQEAREIRSESKGFCGYDWMVKEIRIYGEILGK